MQRKMLVGLLFFDPIWSSCRAGVRRDVVGATPFSFQVPSDFAGTVVDLRMGGVSEEELPPGKELKLFGMPDLD